jgi:hypothetical protein
MGYVEDIQKINSLAKDLLNNGMAESLDTAMDQATKMLSKGETSAEFVGNGTPITEPKNGIVQEPSDEWKKAMAENTKFIVQQFKNVNEKIEQIEKKLNSFRPKKVKENVKEPTKEEIEKYAVEKIFYSGTK